MVRVFVAAVSACTLLSASGIAQQRTPQELNDRVFAAIDQENLPALQAAFAAGASANGFSRQHETPMTAAAKQGNRSICQAVVDAGANVNSPEGGGMTALMWAVFNKQKECLQVMLQKKPNLEQRDSSGRTALFVAEGNNDLALLKTLIDAGADLQATDRAGFTVLGEASQRNVYGTVAYLRSVGAKFNNDTEELYAAAVSGDVVRLRELLDSHRGDPNQKSIYGGNTLTMAAQKGNTPAVRLLIARGVAVDLPDNNRQSALYYAIVSGHESTVDALLDAGAKVQAETPGGRTMLVTLAGWLESPRLVQRLIAAGVGVNQADSYGATPLMAAVQARKPGNAKTLLEAGADVDARDAKGKTARDYAVSRGDAEMVALLSGHR